ncbi:MAG: dienelactone hydrolase family protein [Nocardioidaceae bacterium]|nr:dienelactone hydrolase family protein [Nocardioidaceae bacterium]
MTTLTIPTPEGEAEAFLARPPSGGTAPGVLFCMDAFGLRPQIRTMIDRIASWGYVVLAPHLFYREGTVAELALEGDLRDPAVREGVWGIVGPRVAGLTAELAAGDLAAYVGALRGLDGVGPGPLGVTGYCMGARHATRAACQHPEEIGAAGGFHAGGLVTDQPDSPHLGLANARARFVFGHADQDRSMTPEQAATLDETLRSAGLEFRSAIYPGSPHGYTMADTASYDEAGAERHFRELRELLDGTLR